MKRASAPSYDLFKLAVTVALIAILLLMLLRGCATISAAPAATESSAVSVPAASDTSSAIQTETEAASPSNTPEALAPSLTPTVELTAAVDETTPTSTPAESLTTETPQAAIPASGSEQGTSCNTSVPSRLSVGDTAQVVQRLNMRSDASITAPILQTNSVNTRVEIIGGPVCTPAGERAYLWWQIRLANGVEGWSAESPLNEATYLLEPIQ
jgi:hypothetical protein